jgi:AcrR family transcriptional regulator
VHDRSATVAAAGGRGSRGARTRARLLQAATRVFAERGLQATRVDDIVAAARTSHGTFYLYFANKEELFAALAGEVAAELQALADDLPEHLVEDRAALRAWLERLTRTYRTHGAVLRAWTEAEVHGDAFGRLGTDLHAQFARALLRRLPRLTGLDPQLTAVALVAMIERLNYYQLAGHVRLRRDVMLDALTDAVVRMLDSRR